METYHPEDVCDSNWFAVIRAGLMRAGVKPSDLAIISQGHQDSISLTMPASELLIRGVRDNAGGHAGLAETTKVVRDGLKGTIKDVHKVSAISIVAAESLLRYVHVLDLTGDAESARHLPFLTLRQVRVS